MKYLNSILALTILGFCFLYPRLHASDYSQPKTSRLHNSATQDPHQNLTVDKQIQVALQHKDENRVNLAIETLTKALKTNRVISKDVQLYAVRGSIYLEQAQAKLALSDFERGLAIAPNDVSLLINRAQVYRQFGQIKQALRDLNTVLKIDSKSLAALFNRGSIFFSSSDYELALIDFNQCIAINPHAAAAYFNRATTYKILGKPAQAIKDLQRFIELNKNSEWNKTAKKLLSDYQQELSSIAQ